MKILNDLIYESEYECTGFDLKNTKIENVTSKPDAISENTLFVLIKSISFDINKIISYVKSKKPAVIVTESDVEIESDTVPILRVNNARKILAYIFLRFYDINLDKIKIIGITGTNGKTTTANILTQILRQSQKKVGLISTGSIRIGEKSINPPKYSMTTPDPDILYKTLREMQDAECEYVVMEVSSHALFFEKTSPIKFEIGVFTNLSPEHLDFHKSIEEYYKTKMKLIENSKLGIFNIDDDYGFRAYSESSCHKKSIGMIKPSYFCATNLTEMGLLGNEFIFHGKNEIFKIKTKLPGIYNVYNTLAAAACAVELGISPENIKKAISNIGAIDGRFEIVRDAVTVIIDYAHTEKAMENVLKTINNCKNPEQKLTTVFGCGGDRYREKRPLMAKTAEIYSDKIIVTTDNSRSESPTEIIKEILSGFSKSANRVVVTERASAIERAILSSDNGDIILLIGKGHERYNIDKNGYHKFDEREIIRNALKKRREILKQDENRT